MLLYYHEYFNIFGIPSDDRGSSPLGETSEEEKFSDVESVDIDSVIKNYILVGEDQTTDVIFGLLFSNVVTGCPILTNFLNLSIVWTRILPNSLKSHPITVL